MGRLPRSEYVLCVRNEKYPASLERRKLYRRIPDSRSEQHGLGRIIDESGEDDLYPARFFTSIPISKRVDRILSRTKKAYASPPQLLDSATTPALECPGWPSRLRSREFL